jgi:uncharacterized membrane protein (DUF485 family)
MAHDPTARGGAGHWGDDRSAAVDWTAVERSPEFRELIARKRRFVLPATIFFLAWYFGFVILAGYAEAFMRESIYQGFTVGYLLALSQFVMVFVLGFWYLRVADRVFDPLARKAAQRAEQVRREGTEPEVRS